MILHTYTLLLHVLDVQRLAQGGQDGVRLPRPPEDLGRRQLAERLDGLDPHLRVARARGLPAEGAEHRAVRGHGDVRLAEEGRVAVHLADRPAGVPLALRRQPRDALRERLLGGTTRLTP